MLVFVGSVLFGLAFGANNDVYSQLKLSKALNYVTFVKVLFSFSNSAPLTRFAAGRAQLKHTHTQFVLVREAHRNLIDTINYQEIASGNANGSPNVVNFSV